MEFGTKVIKLVKVILNERRFNKSKDLFLFKDVVKLLSYFFDEIKKIDFN